MTWFSFLPSDSQLRNEKIATDPESLIFPTLNIHIVGANANLVDADYSILLSRLPLLPNVHVTFVGFQEKHDLFNDSEHESMFTKRTIWRERGLVGGRKVHMSCYRGSYGEYFGSANCELPDLTFFFNSQLYQGGLGSSEFAPDLAALASVGRGAVGVVTGSHESVSSDQMMLRSLGWGLEESEQGMGKGKLLTGVEKNEFGVAEEHNGFYFAFECQGWTEEIGGGEG